MNQNSIGGFIQQLRKEKGLTQKELGNLISVSDKTISKWENSNSVPDTAILPALCEALGISVNELLYGEKIPPETYSKKAEENIMNLLKEGQKDKKSERWTVALGIVLLAVVLFVDMKIIRLDVLMFLDVWSVLLPSCIWAAIVLISGKRKKADIIRILKKTAIPVGGIVTLISIVNLLGQLSNPEVIGATLAVAMLTMIYSLIVYVVLCVMEQRENR